MGIAILLRGQRIIRRLMVAPETSFLIVYDLAGLVVFAIALYGPYIWLKWLMIIFSLISLGFAVASFYHMPPAFEWAQLLGLADIALTLWVISYLYRDVKKIRQLSQTY